MKPRLSAVENYEKWHNEHKEHDFYLMIVIWIVMITKQVQWNTFKINLKTFLVDHHYYELAIPLIRQFSKSYDHYYKKLTEASDYYLKQKGDAPQ